MLTKFTMLVMFSILVGMNMLNIYRFTYNYLWDIKGKEQLFVSKHKESVFNAVGFAWVLLIFFIGRSVELLLVMFCGYLFTYVPLSLYKDCDVLDDRESFLSHVFPIWYLVGGAIMLFMELFVGWFL